tara:strand:+ start:4263 stop:4931 length:669 start_codon:yes stop_codon:yes gene_type:complete
MEYKMNDILVNCINEIASLSNEDKVNIKGKFYTTVATRVEIFRKHFGSSGKIVTEILVNDLQRVVVQADIYIYKDGKWELIGRDHAEEFRDQGMVNKTSALENCCTSSIGRALSACGIGGSEYASSFEVDNAINSKPEAPDTSSGYNIKELNGNIKSNCKTASDFLVQMRVEYQNCLQEEKSFKGIYLMNKDQIDQAYESVPASDKEVKDGFKALIELGESA